MINEISKDFFDAYRNNGSDGSEGMISVQSMPVVQALGDALKRKETPTAIFAMGGGMPDAIRTHDLQSRSLTLYPTELQAYLPAVIISNGGRKVNTFLRTEKNFVEGQI